jgi:hypothetical protein
MKIFPKLAQRTALASAMAAALGTAVPVHDAAAAIYTFNYEGYFRMLDPLGAALANTSITGKGVNQYETPITGTMTYDTVTGAGEITMQQFGFFNNPIPAEATGISYESIGGNQLLMNMLFNWGGNNGIPVSVVLDASGFFNALAGIAVTDTIDSTAAGSVRGAADGTYVGGAGTHINAGYLDLGVTPIATTKWNTTPTCPPGGGNTGACMNVSPSGELPLVADATVNNNDWNALFMGGDGSNDDGMGGNPMLAGPFENYNANFEFTSLTLVSDGAGPVFTDPADIDHVDTTGAIPGGTVTVNLGTVADEGVGVTMEYSTDGKALVDGTKTWVADDGVSNPFAVPITGTVTTVTVDWRADDAGVQSFATQTVTVTLSDSTAPTFTSFPVDFSVSVDSTSETVVFEGPTSGRGTVEASDNIDSAPIIEWSLDGLDWTAETAGADESSNAFGAGANTVYWRVTDATGNETVTEQTVTLNLPTGIIGQPCTVDPDLLNTAIGNRQVEGVFTMRDPAGAVVGTVDPFVTGSINPAMVCADASCTDSGAELSSPTPFYGNLWTTNTIRLFNQPGTYTFNTVQDGNPSLSMTVGDNQLGAHMLFDWSVNSDIDVVLVWNYGCGSAELVTTDPDGDGIIGTRMVDGPFKGFNAAFDISTIDGQTPITTGGYSVTVPAVNNSVANTSPLPVDPGTIGTTLGGVTITGEALSDLGAADDSSVVTSCFGGCFDFSVSGRAAGETIQVVLPLSEPIPYYALYRKYNATNDSWANFVVNGTDNVMTAAINEDGSCPEPGAGDYAVFSSSILAGMLRPDDQCVQLTITDNGPNDSDPADGVIADPSGVGVTSGPAAPEAKTSSGGGCSLSTDTSATQRLDLWLVAGLLGLFGLRRKLQRH